VIDLHVHTNCSDGTVTPADVIATAQARGLTGLSVTDHNGIWGLTDAAIAAQQLQLSFIQGIEISTSYHGIDVHILGYSRAFKASVLETGLAETRAGYETRIKKMAELCQQAGFSAVSWEAIQAKRAHVPNPSYVTYDVTEQLQTAAGLTSSQARQLTVRGGACYVPYGQWAMSPVAAIELIKEAGGIAVLAHPGVIIHEAGPDQLGPLVKELVAAGLTGLEVWHPFHTSAIVHQLEQVAATHQLFTTAGSDWHGPDRFTDSDLGSYGLSETAWQQFQSTLG
jgi:3',5'-nucleoside bisphosphate phosphatase